MKLFLLFMLYAFSSPLVAVRCMTVAQGHDVFDWGCRFSALLRAKRLPLEACHQSLSCDVSSEDCKVRARFAVHFVLKDLVHCFDDDHRFDAQCILGNCTDYALYWSQYVSMGDAVTMRSFYLLFLALAAEADILDDKVLDPCQLRLLRLGRLAASHEAHDIACASLARLNIERAKEPSNEKRNILLGAAVEAAFAAADASLDCSDMALDHAELLSSPGGICCSHCAIRSAACAAKAAYLAQDELK